MKAEIQMLGVQVVARDHMTSEWRGWHELQGSDTSPGYFFYHGALPVDRHSAAWDVSQACAAMEIAPPQDWLHHVVYICVVRTIDSWSMWLLWRS